jgi:uncharacterized protein YlxP (DUF503 family)
VHVAAIEIELHIPECHSLKEKRGRLKPLLARLHKEFNVSAAEIDHLNNHHSSIIGCVVVANDQRHVQRVLAKIPAWIETNRPDLQLVDDAITLL